MSGFSGWAQCLEASPRLCVRWEWEVYYIFSLCNIRHRGGDKLSIAPDVFTTFAFRNTSSASKKTFSYRWQTPKQSRMTGERWAKIILMSLTGSWIMARRWKMKASSSHQEQKRTIKATMSITRILSHRWCLIQKVKVDSLLNIIFQERMILPTPPLPPWKGRRTVQRSYSSEMLNTDSMLRYSNTGKISVYKPLIGQLRPS